MSQGNKTFAGIIGLLLLLVAVGALLYVDIQAQHHARLAFERIDLALAAGQSIDDAQIHSWLGRHPTRTYDGEDKKFHEVYEYRGIFRTRTVDVEYIKRAAALVNAVTIR